MARGSPSVLVVGDAALDLVFEVGDAEAADEKWVARSSRRGLGGTGANAAATLAALGSPVRLLAAIGMDQIGAWVSEAVAAANIDPSCLVTVHGGTTVAVIVLSGDRRSVYVDRGVADALEPTYVGNCAVDADLTYLSAQPLAVCAAVAKATKHRFVLGIEDWQIAGEASAWLPVIGRAAALVTNRAGANALRTGGIDITATPEGAPTFVTLGADGCDVYQGSAAPVHVPTLKVDVLDATGAGDCFAGTLCHFLAGGADPIAAARLSNVAAALSTTALGAQGYLPTEAAIRSAAHAIASTSGEAVL